MEFQKCIIIETEGKYLEAPVAWILQKDSPYSEIFDYYLLEFIEKGQWSSMQKKYMAGPQVCPDFSAQPIGFESACTPFLIFLIAIILTFGLLIFEILNEKCFSNSKSSTKQTTTLEKVEKSQRIIEKNPSIIKFLRHVMKEETLKFE